MAEVTTEDVTLTERDAKDILEELQEAMNRACELGLVLKLLPHEVEAIRKTYPDPQDRLLQVILAFLRQVEPRPTWRVIVDALSSPAVNLTALARRVEAAHFPDPTATCDVVPETTDTEPAETASTATIDQEPKPPVPSVSPVQNPIPLSQQLINNTDALIQQIKEEISEFEKRFNELKRDCRGNLQKKKVLVFQVVDALTDLPADDFDEHKQFLESHISVYYQANDHAELIGQLSFNMNYLSYHLLDYLASKFDLDGVKGKMETYKSDLGQFRKKTPLTLFCRAQKRKRIKPTAEFREMVAEFDWPEDVTLEVVDQFREEYTFKHNLHECAMMVAQVRPGSFIVTWFIPESVVKKLKGKVPRAILKKYSVTKLEIAGTCVYRQRKPQEAVPSTSSGPGSAATATVPDPSKPASEEELLFVEAPSEDFYCPVTLDILREPHLTSCCGKHLSQEAATRIQAGGGACPLCKAPRWSTMLDKHFQRGAKSVFVFHRHEERVCGWQGELGKLNSHVQSCPMRDPNELLKLSRYGGHGTQVPHQEQSPLRVGALQAAYRTVPSAKSAAHTCQEDPMTPLTASARKGDIQEVLKLLQNKEDPNPAADCTPLKEVSRRGDTEMALALLKAGADPNYVTDDWTALMEACRVGKTEMVELLINHGADPNTVNRSYWTALMAASNRGHYKAVDILLLRGANPHMQDNTGWSALLAAVFMGHDKIVLRLGQDQTSMTRIKRVL